MKKIIFSTLAFAASLTMMGEGYQVNTLSVKQEGMGHTGVAQKLGAESMIFNPAGMAFMDKTLDLSAGVTAIFSEVTALHEGTKYETNNDASTPFQISGAFSIFDNLKAGVTINTPYGSGIDWSDNWPGAVLSQSVKLQVFNIQPTVAYKILPNLSVGAGLMIAWGSIDLNKGLVEASSINTLVNENVRQNLIENGIPAEMINDALIKQHASDLYLEESITPASVNLAGDADVAFGYNVGILWDINEKISFGANYRSKMDMKVKSGDAKLTYANEKAKGHLDESLKYLNKTNFKAQLPAVSVLSFGISYKPIEKLTLAFDAQMSGWSAYEELAIDFVGLDAPFDQKLTKNYKDSWAYRLGAQYAMTDRLDLRAGFVIDNTPVDEDYFNPETPGMTRLLPSVGLSFRPTKNVSIDLAFTYVNGLSRNGSNYYNDLIAGQYFKGLTDAGCSAETAITKTENVFNCTHMVVNGESWFSRSFKAKYGVTAFIPAIGLSYSF